MSNIPKTRVRRTVNRAAFTALLGPVRNRWGVILDGHLIAEFDNHPDALAYAHHRAAERINNIPARHLTAYPA